VGESRADVEKQFGHEVPKPDRLSGYAVFGSEAGPGSDRHLGQYAYDAESMFCAQTFRGVVVFYDVHDRVKRWKRFSSVDGC
jgi:hypothetical protein